MKYFSYLAITTFPVMSIMIGYIYCDTCPVKPYLPLSCILVGIFGTLAQFMLIMQYYIEGMDFFFILLPLTKKYSLISISSIIATLMFYVSLTYGSIYDLTRVISLNLAFINYIPVRDITGVFPKPKRLHPETDCNPLFLTFLIISFVAVYGSQAIPFYARLKFKIPELRKQKESLLKKENLSLELGEEITENSVFSV